MGSSISLQRVWKWLQALMNAFIRPLAPFICLNYAESGAQADNNYKFVCKFSTQGRGDSINKVGLLTTM